MLRATGVLVLAALAGCTASYRTTSGQATAYPGLAGGRTSSIVVGDRGGLLTRIGLGSLGALAAGLGSIKSVDREVTVDHYGDHDVITTRDTITVDPEGGKGGMALVDLANDPKSDLSGMASTLEIASRDLGGDTSGWMFKLGAYGKQWRGNIGFSFFGGFGFGKFTFHDRELKTHIDLNSVFSRRGDWAYRYMGFPMRVGLLLRPGYAKPRRQAAAEIFVQADFNAYALGAILAPDESWSPSPWSTGLRLSLGPAFVQGSVSTSTMRASATSLGLEGGVDF